MEAWFISDIHLKSAQERNGEILLRFLRSLAKRPNPEQVHLFMLGDIFDLWVGGSEYFARKFQPIMDGLKELKATGAQITYIEGNHDVHVESYFQKKLGIDVFVEAQFYRIDGMNVRCEHGDLINLEDEKYLKYRDVIRNPRIKPLGNILPGWFWDYIGNRASKKSRARSSGYANVNQERLQTMIRQHAERVYSEKSFDLIISGHMHIYDDYTFKVKNQEVRSVNLGSWYGEEIKAFVIENGAAEWRVIS